MSAAKSRMTSNRVSQRTVNDFTAIIEELMELGRCTPQALVDEARDPKSKIHRYFEWNDATAAEQYRVLQAKYYMRSINVEYTTESSGVFEMRAFIPTYVDGGGNQWKPAMQIASTIEGMDQLLESARRELKSFTKKYAALRAFAKATSMLNAIDDFVAAAAE